MAGRRRAAGKPKTRAQLRTDLLSRHMASAAAALTPEQRVAAAFDGLRMAAARAIPDEGALALNDAAQHMLGLTRWLTESERR